MGASREASRRPWTIPNPGPSRKETFDARELPDAELSELQSNVFGWIDGWAVLAGFDEKNPLKNNLVRWVLAEGFSAFSTGASSKLGVVRSGPFPSSHNRCSPFTAIITVRWRGG